MDDKTNQSPPAPDAEEHRGQAMPPPAETLPTRPGATAPTRSTLPPVENPAAGTAMPPPEPPTTYSTAPNANMDPGKQRVIEDVNLDAVAQADQSAEPDRYSADALSDLVDGGTVPVPVQQINRALIEIWKSTTSGGEHEGKVSVTLMRAMNLVAYCQDDARADEVTAVVSRVTGRHPCRTVLIVNQSGSNGAAVTEAGPADDTDLDATMSAHCQIASATGKQVCCEQVTISAQSPTALYRASTIALNLLITDLPVFLWWAQGMPFSNVVLTNLEDSIDRLIVDSAGFPDPLGGLLGLSRVLVPGPSQREHARYAPSDMNWARLAGWREALAHLFDNPDYTASLWHIGSMELQYAVAPETEPNPVQALLFAGWLATRLNWEFHTSAAAAGHGSPGDMLLTLHQGMRSIPVNVRAVSPPGIDQQGLVAVSLTTNDVNPRTFRMTHGADDMFVECTVEQEGEEPALYKVRHSRPDETTLLDTELELFGHDAIYEEALQTAGTMAWASLPLRRRADLSVQYGLEQRRSSFDPRF